MNIFEVASRQKLRFETAKGLLSIEDLWELPLTSATGKTCLDEIAIALHHQLRTTSDVVSFVDDAATLNPVVKLRFDVVKHVIDERKRESVEAATARSRADTKQQILAALAKKRENAIDAMTEDDLVKKLAEL